MIARWRWLLAQTTKRLWFRASLFSVLGVATALLAIVFKDHVPLSLPGRIGADAVDKILGIIASSMLAVTTFSLSTMVTAYGAASSGVTPRASTLVMEDTTTQNALATFIGSFLFSLVGIIALSTGAYGTQGRVVLFVVTIVVIILIVSTLLRWIDHLSNLGSVGETIDRVEAAAVQAIRRRVEQPYLGGRKSVAGQVLAPEARTLCSEGIGYVQHIDVRALSELAERHQWQVFVEVLPGDFVHEGSPLARVVGVAADWPGEALLATITVGVGRVFEHDPRFGICVLAEIASRALSPAVNDPGTAIDVIGRGIRAFAAAGKLADEPGELLYPRLFLRGLDMKDMFEDFFSPIARDGASLVEIDLRLVKALASLGQMYPGRFKVLVEQHCRWVLERGEVGLALEDDRRRLRECVMLLEQSGRP
jgi:uncharacterized membrane protein